MRKVVAFLAAPYLMITLFVVLASAMGIATFVENDFGTNAAKVLYYNSWWFEGIFILLGVNMFLNIMKSQLWVKGKLPVLFFHLSFFIIIIGAAVTRYVGFEGVMHIREGHSTDTFLSLKTYVDGALELDGQTVLFKEEVLMSDKSKGDFNAKLKIADKQVVIKSVGYFTDTSFKPVEDESGYPLLSLVVSGMAGRRNVDLFFGEQVKVGKYRVGFGVDEELDFNIMLDEGRLMIQSKHPMFTSDMASQTRKEFDAMSPHPFVQRILYGAEEFFIVQTNYLKGASLQAVAAQTGQGNSLESVVFNIEIDGRIKQMNIQGNAGVLGDYKTLLVDGIKLRMRYGAEEMKTPFAIQLNDFLLERYPGSESPSSFASEVTLIDKSRSVQTDFRIFMNNILDYRGYRFYQSSYDKDEKGTVLSVNKDYWGTMITYIGYFLMALSMLLSLMASKGRFVFLAKRLSDLSKQKRALTVLVLLVCTVSVFAQDIDRIIKVNAEQAKAFGELWVQDNGGRTKPMNSMNGEVLRKLVKHNSFKGYSADRVVLSILSDPESWESIPLITVKAESIKVIVGNAGKKAAFNDFFGESGNYKLHELVEQAYRTKPSGRTKAQNDLIKIDEQVNVFYLVKTGKLLKIFPVPDKSMATWLLPGENVLTIAEGDSLFVRNVFSVYLQSLKDGDVAQSKMYVDAILKFQNKYAKEILPSGRMNELEIFYNKANLFLMISPILFVLGLLLLIMQFVYLFLPKKSPKWANYSGMGLLLMAFVVYSTGLALRWYISGHAPWSNSYESMLYIGWSILLAGLVFTKKSGIVVAVASLFSGIVLMVAHLSWMNPEITNLVPVLKSYWLTIHVAVIVMSYGFLGLGAFVAFFNLILMGLKKGHEKKVEITIAELSAVIEMGLTVGLYLMTIGSFLGGIWANESWGRYWGWDPKETWSLVTIVVYAIILHLRFVPGLKSLVVFNVVSVLGFFSVLMTYLGVNYYLAGMHSYAKGDPVPIPDFVYYLIVSIMVVAFYAIYNSYKINKEARK